VAAYGNAEDALRGLPSLPVEVALVDINLPGKSGVALVRELQRLVPKVQIVMLTVETDHQRVFECLKAGASGYLVKNVRPERILEAIRDVSTGGSPMSSQVARMVVSAFRESEPGSGQAVESQLSPRELEILRLLACGDRSKEIADKLGISVATVNTHVRHIYERLHVRSRAEAVARLAQS
jgi:DNA-binding NarL/FixJ family response regulator